MKFRAGVGSESFDVFVERENGFYRVEIDGKVHQVDAQKLEGDFYSMLMDDRSYEVSVEWAGEGYDVRHGATTQRVQLFDPSRRGREKAAQSGPLKIASDMPGKVVRVLVAAGQDVDEGQGLVVVEAMKMENEIAAPRAGKVKSVDVEPGQAVEGGSLLVVVE